jgi:hypothetical protein
MGKIGPHRVWNFTEYQSVSVLTRRVALRRDSECVTGYVPVMNLIRGVTLLI